MKKKAEMQALREAETAIKENIAKEKAVRGVDLLIVHLSCVFAC